MIDFMKDWSRLGWRILAVGVARETFDGGAP